jgi:hypothetical protein
MSLTSDILAMLATAGVGTVGTTLFEGVAPFEVDACLVVNQYAGGPPLSPTVVENPSVQALTRAVDYTAAWSMANACLHALDAIKETTQGGHRYLQVDARQSPEYLGQDERQRHIFVVNFDVLAEAQ